VLQVPFTSERLYNIEEYLELEKLSEEKLEFWDGIVWSVSGANRAHVIIAGNVLFELARQIRDAECEIFTSHMRLKVPARLPYRYPDLSALCGDAIFEKLGGIDVLVNPQLIGEVLSESTEAFDRGDKFSYYKSIESFTEYLLVAQHRPHISQFVKQGDGFWINTEANSLDDTIELSSVPCTLSLASVYRDVVFEPVSSTGSGTAQSTG
jgi:Uma2 family endonuclease